MGNKVIAFESKFGKPEKFNSQFHLVKIYVAYAGMNRNFSIISKETFEKMIPSLYGVPIVGEWKGEDFGNHGGKIEISDEGVEFIDTTKPYGYIDSSSTVQWEKVIEDDGTERDYLTATGFLWTGRYPEALKVLDNKNNQSMEISVFSGDMSEEYPEYFEITDGEFSALCVLGEDVEPCFESAKVSQFNLDKDTFKAEFTQMVTELKKSIRFAEKEHFKGGEEVKKENFDEANEVEEVVENTEEPVEETTEPLEGEQSSAECEENKEVVEEEKFTKTFELSHDDIRAKLYGLLYEIEEQDDTWYYIDEVFDDYFIYSNYEKYFKQGYLNTDVDIAFEGERVQMFVEFLTAEEVETLKSMRKNYSLLEEEVKSLREFKAQKDQEAFEIKQAEERQAKIDHINTEYQNIANDVKEMFISKVDEYETTDDIDADLCVYIVKNKVSFSKIKQDKTNIKVNVEGQEINPVASPYGNLF